MTASEINVEERVYVAPLGNENERISEAAVQLRADKAILLEYLPPTGDITELHDAVETTLEEEGISIERRRGNLEDLFDAISIFVEILEAHKDDKIWVNLSTGNKISSVAGMIACMVTEEGTPCYVKAEQFTSNAPGAHQGRPAEGVKSIVEIPSYPMDRPSDEQLRIMRHIADAETEMRDQDEPFRTRSDLIKFAEQESLPFISDSSGESRAKHNLVRRHIVDPLRDEWGFIKEKEVSQTKRVMLTEAGENTLRGFEYITEQDA